MLFVAIVALIFGYGVVYSGVQTLRGGWDANAKTAKVHVGILECLTPGFDAVALEQSLGATSATTVGGDAAAGAVQGFAQAANGQAHSTGSSAQPAPVTPQKKTTSPILSILTPGI